MTLQPSRRALLRSGGLLLVTGLGGCAAALDHPDLRLRNRDGDEHDLSVEIVHEGAGETVLSETFELGRKTVDTTVDSLFEEGASYSVRASLDSGAEGRDVWEIGNSNPKYHVSIRETDGSDRGEPHLTMGRLGGF